MKNKIIYAIGVMSGTSLDGIDLVYVKFNEKNYTNFDIIAAETVPYSKLWRKKLQKAINFSDKELRLLDTNYGVLLSGAINSFIKNNKIQLVDFISSHGHTVFHKPEIGITLQIGDGQVLATKTNKKVVCDFRTQDVNLGGQGAPLVPIGDELLFSEYNSCLNLGGFANISFKTDNNRIAFDICPVNIVLNNYANKLGFEYDNGGQIASEGKLNYELLEKLNQLEFYKKEAPKSLGLEWVLSEIFPLIDLIESDISSILRTFIEHISVEISKYLVDKKDVIITGGGVFNSFLIDRIKHLSSSKIILPDTKIINFKEALIFAFLGLLRIDDKINCLSSVTGAKRNHSSGVIFYP